MTNRVALFNLVASASKIRLTIGVQDLTNSVKSLSVIDEVNCPYGVFIRTTFGSGIPFSSMACDEFAAHGSDVGIGPSWPHKMTIMSNRSVT
jgi:hypothetical protein